MQNIVAPQSAPYLVTVKEAGRLLAMKPWPVLKLIERGALKAAKLEHANGGWYWAVSVESVRQYAEQLITRAESRA